MRIPYKLRLLKWILFRKMDGERFLLKSYKDLFGKDLNLENPQTFAEKLNTRMVLINRHGNPVFTNLADKLLVRDYIKQKVGEKYLIPLVWHGNRAKDIPFNILPDRCVIKTNHGSGEVYIKKGKVNNTEVVNIINKWMSINYYWGSREYQYYKIPRMVLIEEFLDDDEQDGPLDYRFWCFHGHAEIIQIDNHKHDINPFVDRDWNPLPLSYRPSFRNIKINKPSNIQEMLDVASSLSREFDFVRVDLYNIRGRIYFGELTFTPVGGGIKFRPNEWDKLLGQKWNFDKNNQT